jgi:hypothetical protein
LNQKLEQALVVIHPEYEFDPIRSVGVASPQMAWAAALQASAVVMVM